MSNNCFDMIYLASPYTHPQKQVREQRVLLAKHTAYRMIQQGLLVYSPIVYGHTIEMGEELTQTHEYWMVHCHQMLTACKIMVVCDHIPGWKKSKGVQQEIAWAHTAGIEVRYYSHE